MILISTHIICHYSASYDVNGGGYKETELLMQENKINHYTDMHYPIWSLIFWHVITSIEIVKIILLKVKTIQYYHLHSCVMLDSCSP
jgi:hypothetical protein